MPQHPSILVNASSSGIVDMASTKDHIREAHQVLGYRMAIGVKPFLN
jgi:hypothetical protein